MKKVLITGANSYIGTSFENYVKKLYPNDFSVETVDMIDGTWREKSFSNYDVVFHVAGIAHSDSGKIKPEKAKLYYEVNTDLAIETAKKAKQDGVKQFIFMSSAIVYGESAPIGKRKVITLDTPVSPANCYGDSKVQAEKGILPLGCDDFKVCILRPPMIYGKGCKGNFNTLVKFGKKLPFFPYVKNERSMLYVENLGIFFPQNAEYSSTSELVKEIGACYGKKVRLVKGFSWLIKFLGLFIGVINKAFGNLTYDKSISKYSEDYQRYSLLESVKRTNNV